MDKKRGQVTIFIILGIAILMAGFVLFYYVDLEGNVNDPIPPEAAPVQNFIDQCIRDVTTDAITILGLKGGYIQIPDQVAQNPRSYLASGPGGAFKNPLWWYDGLLYIPTIDSMEYQIEQYVNTELRTCLDTFENFENQFTLTPDGDVSSDVSINEQDVSIVVTYPIVLENVQGNEVRVSQFQQRIDSPLKELYDVAYDVISAENRDFFLEDKTIDLISLDEEIPTTGIDATCSAKTWQKSEITNKLKQLLQVNLPYINVEGTEFSGTTFVSNPFGADTYDQSYFNTHYRWNLMDKTYPNVRVSFDFDERWPLSLQARPSSGNTLRSNAQKGQDLLNFVCLHMWHFTYDVSYPVKVTITKDSPTPYTFAFAFMVNVNHNQPLRQLTGNQAYGGSAVADVTEYCGSREYEVTVYTLENSTFGGDLRGVDLSLICGTFECPLGSSDWLSFGAAAGIQERMPYCVNGILRATGENIVDTQIVVQTDGNNVYDMYITPTTTIENIEIVKHPISNPAAQIFLEQDEHATIVVTSNSGSFESFASVSGDESLPLELINDDHSYNITIFIIRGDELVGAYRGTWDVSGAALRDANGIVFHVAQDFFADDDDTFAFISNLEEHSKAVPTPEII